MRPTMRDEDDLPVLSAVVRGGDAAVIRASRRDSYLSAAAGTTPAPPFPALSARRPGGDAPGRLDAAIASLETDDVARIDLDDGPVGIDANRPPPGRSGRARAARRARGAASVSHLSPEAERLERLVDEIVERHVAAFRREVRDALERELRSARD